MSLVTVTRQPLVLPTYAPQAPERNPMFLEKRVYQGSNGKVYPAPYIDRISPDRHPKAWDSVSLENEFIQVVILPEIGGRIHIGRDKTNGYDFFYRQSSIKPALVGLAGPWMSGGVEFNWPQHHRPGTWMPADVHIEHHPDGAVTVWLSEHDPLNRLKGMHGICLHPGKSSIELKVRVYNRTAHPQTFLWWANVATRVHERYQSFFPPDVYYVADHAKRAMSEFPLCTGRYYGLDYRDRGRRGVPKSEAPAQFVPPAGAYAPNDLSWYANIPVPTSYMCMGTRGNFFGGYDHAREAGVIHIANPHISPGKKQWTWGNHEFGYAWDRNLTDPDDQGEYGPYIEIMAGVYTDNQPDFSFLMPGETKTWSQFWYPLQKIGPAHKANEHAAVSLCVASGRAKVGVAVSAVFAGATVRLEVRQRKLGTWLRDLAPGQPFVEEVSLARGIRETDLCLIVTDLDGRDIIAYQPKARVRGKVPPPATEPPLPQNIKGNDELFVTGLHLDQYRHATRMPELYWREAVRRDPGDSRSHLALGKWHLRRGELNEAEKHLRIAIARLTLRNPNPYDGEAHYQLGLTLREQGRFEDAYAAIYKATWNHAWQAAGYHALAEIDCRRHDWQIALDHLDRALRANADNLRARDLRVLVLRRLARADDAAIQLRDTLALDPLDWWARHLAGQPLTCDTQVRLDLALDYARAGFFDGALAVLNDAKPEPESGTAPLVHYYIGWLQAQQGNKTAAKKHYAVAAQTSPDYCFPSRLEEIAILESAIAANPSDARAHYYLGNLFYDRLRHKEAIRLWQKSARLNPGYSVVWRNLGIGYYNILRQPSKAAVAYDRAFRAAPVDARVLMERDQLWKRLGRPPAARLRELENQLKLVNLRDDLSVELCALYNQTNQPAKAQRLLTDRVFQPWEGGEGQALGQHTRTHLLLGRSALNRGDAPAAKKYFLTALHVPGNLGEARHLLSNQSDIFYWLGEACLALGERGEARAHWRQAAEFRGDFQEMRVRSFSEMTYYSALALKRLGRKAAAAKLLRELLAYARRLERQPAQIEYFATSLPTMLVFEDDLTKRQRITAMFLQAQARLGLGRAAEAKKLLAKVLRLDPNHAQAADLLGGLP
jgi:tetratricopeptide (TPR) repeat protein